MPQDTNKQLTGRIATRCTEEQERKIKALADLLGYDSYADLLRERFIKPCCDQHDTIVEKVGAKQPA